MLPLVPLLLGAGVLGLYQLLRGDKEDDERLRLLTHGARVRTLRSRMRYKGKKGASAKRRLARLYTLRREASGRSPRGWSWKDSADSYATIAKSDMAMNPVPAAFDTFLGPSRFGYLEPVRPDRRLGMAARPIGPSLSHIGEVLMFYMGPWWLATHLAKGAA